MIKTDIWLKSHCPNLSSDKYTITSPNSPDYNCIAWGLAQDDLWWDPTDPYGYWLAEIPRELTLTAFIQLYQKFGYSICDKAEFETGFEKIAIYGKNNEQDQEPTHIARQIPHGRWTSKIGELEDIEHDLDGLKGFYYGEVIALLKRKVN